MSWSQICLGSTILPRTTPNCALEQPNAPTQSCFTCTYLGSLCSVQLVYAAQQLCAWEGARNCRWCGRRWRL